ncbi:MAG: alpha/beta family hydrolase [Mycobacterium leprae]
MGADGAGGGLSETRVVPTPFGDARVQLTPAPGTPRALFVLGHAAGGGIEAPDLAAVRAAGPARGVAVALAEQPYRVAGRRAPAPARQLDVAFGAVVAALRADPAYAAVPLVTGGRSSGARVACRTAAATDAVAVVALAFPLHPPGRRSAVRPRPDREPPDRVGELTAVPVPVLVVAGDRDPFGRPEEFPPGTRVHVVASADHALRVGTDRLAEVVVEWTLAQAAPT